jgi:hypothetical protein
MSYWLLLLVLHSGEGKFYLEGGKTASLEALNPISRVIFILKVSLFVAPCCSRFTPIFLVHIRRASSTSGINIGLGPEFPPFATVASLGYVQK